MAAVATGHKGKVSGNITVSRVQINDPDLYNKKKVQIM